MKMIDILDNTAAIVKKYAKPVGKILWIATLALVKGYADSVLETETKPMRRTASRPLYISDAEVQMEAIDAVIGAVERDFFDSDRINHAQMIFDIADNSLESDTIKYAITKLRDISNKMTFMDSRNEVMDMIVRLSTSSWL